MDTAYERPFRPVDLTDAETRNFPLPAMRRQLTSEESYGATGRASLTLVHGEGLTAVLTAARPGTRFDEHVAGGPTLFVVLSGRLVIEPATGGSRTLEEGQAFALGPHVRHAMHAAGETMFLTVIGEQEPDSAART
jgi:quercetin dioxygenase-like cupin family protein